MNKTLETVFQQAKIIVQPDFNEYIAITTIVFIAILAFKLSFRKQNNIKI